MKKMFALFVFLVVLAVTPDLKWYGIGSTEAQPTPQYVWDADSGKYIPNTSLKSAIGELNETLQLAINRGSEIAITVVVAIVAIVVAALAVVVKVLVNGFTIGTTRRITADGDESSAWLLSSGQNARVDLSRGQSLTGEMLPASRQQLVDSERDQRSRK